MFLGQPAKADRKEPQQFRAVLADAGTADGLLVRLTRLREGFDEDADAKGAIFADGHRVEARSGAG